MLTDFLKLFKAEPADPAEGNNTFNITTMLNDNWDKIEAFVKKLTGLQEITVTTGIAPNYAADLVNFEMVDGRRITVKFNVASTQASTLSINGGIVGGLKKPGGSDMTNIKAGIYTFVVDSGNFIVQGEGGEYGTAGPAETLSGFTVGTEFGVENGTLTLTGDAGAGDVLLNKTFYNTNAKSKGTGTMPNRGSVGTINLTSEGAEYVIPAGYHNGFGKVKAVISGLIASVIKAGVTVGGIAGTFTADANAVASQMLSGVTAYVNGLKVTGTIPSKTAATITPGTANQTIAASQYLSGVQTILGDVDLVAANIPVGKKIFGVDGEAILASGAIKSIQTGSITIPASVTNTTTTVSVVVPANSVLFYNGEFTDCATSPNYGLAELTLTNGTTITAVQQVSGYSTTISYTLVEYNPGVIKSKQSGTLYMNNVSTATITISSVDTTKSILAYTGVRTLTGTTSGFLKYALADIKLTNATTITARSAYTNMIYVSWNLIEFY